MLRYRPFAPGVVVRATGAVDDAQLEKALAAARVTATPVRFSVGSRQPCLERAGARVVVESDEAFAAGWAEGNGPTGASSAGGVRLRLLGATAPVVYEAAAVAGLDVLDEPVCSCGRIELVRWLREQVVTRSLHRYGSVVYARW